MQRGLGWTCLFGLIVQEADGSLDLMYELRILSDLGESLPYERAISCLPFASLEPVNLSYIGEHTTIGLVSIRRVYDPITNDVVSSLLRKDGVAGLDLVGEFPTGLRVVLRIVVGLVPKRCSDFVWIVV